MLDVEHVTKRFASNGPAVLDDVNLHVDAGDLTCVLGASGTGKSTLLHVIAGLTHPDAGTVTLNGRVVDDVAPHRRDITLLMQRPQLLGHLNVVDNVAFGLRVRGIDRRSRRRRAEAMLDIVGLSNLGSRSARELSGGEAQRVALARALVIEPALLLADEPFSSVDAPVRRDLQDLLRSVQRELNTTIVVVTHDLDEALALGRHWAILDTGHVTDHGPARRVYEQPATHTAARLVGFTTALTPTAEPGTLRMIRPEHVVVQPADPRDANAVVSDIRDRGTHLEMTLDVSGTFIRAHVHDRDNFTVGSYVCVSTPAEFDVLVRSGPGQD